VAQLFDKKVFDGSDGDENMGSNSLQRKAQVQSVYVHMCNLNLNLRLPWLAF
jgi:hypothetical protein